MGRPHQRLVQTRIASKVGVIVDTGAGIVNSAAVSNTIWLGQIGR